jgi:hypothetical protein
MKKTKHPPAARTGSQTAEPDEIVADRLLKLGLELRDLTAYEVLPETLRKAQAELRKTIRKCLQQRREPALDEALERAYEEDAAAWRVLRENVEEMSGTILLRRDEGPELEVNAFVVPLFVHTTGGLRSEQCFQDVQAFEQLRDSMKEAGLESRAARVVLVSHAYHPDEIERIGYCHLHDMVHEAADAMTRRKATAADAIARSLRGWPPSPFAPDDSAMELRFLLGFALKSMDDSFYHVPENEAAADRYFEARAKRFRQWSQQVLPLLRRCLVSDGRDMQVDFLYQDLFHGGKDAALAELETLRLLSEAQRLLEQQVTPVAEAKAVIGPADTDEDAVLRIALYAAATDASLGGIDIALGRADTIENATANAAEGLTAMGIRDIRTAKSFDAEGEPTGIRPYLPR